MPGSCGLQREDTGAASRRFLDLARARNYFRLLPPLSEGGVEVDAIWAVTHYYQGTWQPFQT